MPIAGHRNRRPWLGSALNAHFDIAAFQFELGYIFFDEELNEFFQFFLIHRERWDRFSLPCQSGQSRSFVKLKAQSVLCQSALKLRIHVP